MNKDRILLKLVLDKIGFGNLEIDNFTNRMILQKRVYLLQLTGLDLRYRYNWYLKGPYCPALADAVFTLKEEIEYDNEFEDYELNSKTISKFDTLNKITHLPDTLETSEPEWLELLASLHYLKHIAYWAKKNNPQFEEVFNRLRQSKSHFAEKENLAKAAWKKLEDNGLVEHKTLE